VQALGVPDDIAEALGIGWAKRGTMLKRVLIPLRSPSGKLVGYNGIAPALMSNCQQITSSSPTGGSFLFYLFASLHALEYIQALFFSDLNLLPNLMQFLDVFGTLC
jgi:hypothetical protein